MAPWLILVILLLSTSHPERMLLAIKATVIDHFTDFDFKIMTIITNRNYPWLSEWCSQQPNKLLADSATAGTKRLKPCGCLCCFTIYSWRYQRGMILFSVYTDEQLSIVSSNILKPTLKNYTWINNKAPEQKDYLNLATASGRLRLSHLRWVRSAVIRPSAPVQVCRSPESLAVQAVQLQIRSKGFDKPWLQLAIACLLWHDMPWLVWL